ncbi:MAG: S8 family serine peptidase, partial [bacterium]
TLAAWKSRNDWPSSIGTVGYPAGTSGGDAPVGSKAPFSSAGPTRDGRQKPDLAAPGMAIISVYSADTSPAAQAETITADGKYYVTQGTSMASPFTCGVVALMLEKDGSLTAAEIKAALRSSAVSDSYTGATWNAHYGAGKLDAQGALNAIGGGGTDPDGDIDSDGGATVLDVIALVNYILSPGTYPLTTDQREAADVFPAPDGDDNLNASDVVRIVAFILGTDSPGKLLRPVAAELPPVAVDLGAPFADAAGWWVPVTVTGEELAAGQFAVTLRDGEWLDADNRSVRVEASRELQVAHRIAGHQLRLLFYDFHNQLPTDGITLHLPCRYLSVEPDAVVDAATFQPSFAGLLVVDARGEPRQTVVSATPAPLGGTLAAFPNPAVGRTAIRFSLPRREPFTLTVYDVRGRLVKELRQGDGFETAGVVDWDGRNGSGRQVSAGLYLVRLVTRDEVLSRKVLLQR